MQTHLPSHLGRLCRGLSHGATAGIAALIAGYGLVVLEPLAFAPPVETVTGLTPPKRIALALLTAGLFAPALIALWITRGLFARYGRGDVFSYHNATAIRRIGGLLLVGTGLAIAGRTAAVLILTHDNPPGQRSLAISLASHDLLFALLGGLLLVIGWVMAEATRQAEENRLFV